MFRGCRSIIFAFIWLSLSAQHSYAQADARVGDALQNIAATYDKQAKKVERSPLDRQCDPGDDQRDSDLCAQWKAADAADKAAWWAAFSGWFGGLSFLGVLAAIGLAFHSNRIAQDTAKRQLRAYVSFSALDDVLHGEGPDTAPDAYSFHPIWKNTGQTPALKCSIMSGWFRSGSTNPVFEVDKGLVLSESTVGSGVIQRGATGTVPISDIISISGSGEYIYVVSEIIYEDIFGGRHAEEICCRLMFNPGGFVRPMKDEFVRMTHNIHSTYTIKRDSGD